jgi:hypothetical protein
LSESGLVLSDVEALSGLKDSQDTTSSSGNDPDERYVMFSFLLTAEITILLILPS